ncbi:ATP-binding cassette domain-containing protein [Pseudomonas putida]
MKLYRTWRALPVAARQALRPALRWMVLAAMLDAATGLALVPVLHAWLDPHRAGLGAALLTLLGLTLVQALVAVCAQLRGFLAASRWVGAWLAALLGHLPRLPWNAHGEGHAGLLRGPVMGSMSLPAHVLGPWVAACVTPTTLVLGLVAVAPWLALWAAAAFALLVLALRWAARRSMGLEQHLHAMDGEARLAFQTFANQQALVRSAGRGARARQALEQALMAQCRGREQLQRRGLPASLALGLVVQGLFALALCLGVRAVVQGQLTPALLLALLVLLARFVEPLSQLAHLDQGLRGAQQALEQLQGVLQLPGLATPVYGTTPSSATLDCENVTLASPQGTAIVTDFSLSCPAGSFTAIVGPSGSGKTTVLALLGRGLDPDSGQVRLGGVDLRQLDDATLGRLRGQAFQHNDLVEGSLRWNLTLATPDASAAQVQQALHQCAMAQEVARLPAGLDSPVGPGGALLSGGQRQRVALARVLLGGAPLMLFDEPTSHLDAQVQARVIDSLAALAGQHTVILTTHSPALARRASRIAVLEQGRLSGFGSHAQLLEEHPWYRDFAQTEAVV